MIVTNEAPWDRTLRILLGAGLLYVVWSGAIGTWAGGALLVVSLVLLITGLLGWCPLYSLLKVSTRHKDPTGVRRA